MTDTSLSDIAAEIQSAEDSLKARIEKLFGAVASTDFAGEFAQLMDAHDKLMVLSGLQAQPPDAPAAPETPPAPPAPSVA
jgi:hypothetical protein